MEHAGQSPDWWNCFLQKRRRFEDVDPRMVREPRLKPTRFVSAPSRQSGLPALRSTLRRHQPPDRRPAVRAAPAGFGVRGHSSPHHLPMAQDFQAWRRQCFGDLRPESTLARWNTRILHQIEGPARRVIGDQEFELRCFQRIDLALGEQQPIVGFEIAVEGRKVR